MTAAQTVVHHRQQTVCVRRKVNADNLGFLVHDVVDKTGILVREAVVILPPDMGREQVVQRGDLSARHGKPKVTFNHFAC